jgi:hypothetical protein
MASKPIIFVVGADKGGVGKTTVTRLLLNYLQSRSVQTRIFDTEYPSGDLKRFYPAEVVDMRTLQDQQKVFDNLSVDAVTVLDIRAGVMSPTFAALDAAFFLDAVRSGEIILVLLHVLGSNVASLSEVGEISKVIGSGSVRHLVVKNHIDETEFSLINDPAYAAVFAAMATATINVPKLPAIIAEKINKLGVTFEEFKNTDVSIMARGTVKRWLQSVYVEFDRVNIPGILSA